MEVKVLRHSRFGDSVTDGIECIPGSAMYFVSTGMSLKDNIQNSIEALAVTRFQFACVGVPNIL